jgi:chromosome segregation ATPase
MARVHTVEKNRSTLKCGRCHATINPGDGYRYAQPGFRNRNKLVRCMKSSCAFRQSELTNSKMSTVYAAVETAEDAISGWDGEDVDDAEDVAQALRDCAEQIREVAEEYATAAEAMQGAGEEMQEKADALEGWADEIESAADDLPSKPEDEDDEDEDENEKAKAVKEPTDDNEKAKAAAEAEAKKKAEEKKAEEQAEALDAWRDEVREAATGPLGNNPL